MLNFKIHARAFLQASAATTAAAAASPKLLQRHGNRTGRQGFQPGRLRRAQGDSHHLPRLQHPGRRHGLCGKRPHRQAGGQSGARFHARQTVRQGQLGHVVHLRSGPHPLSPEAGGQTRRRQVEAHHLGRGADRDRPEARCRAQGRPQHHHAEIRPQPLRRRHRPLHEYAGIGHRRQPHLGVRILQENRHGADLGAGHRNAGFRQREIHPQLRLQHHGSGLLPQPVLPASCRRHGRQQGQAGHLRRAPVQHRRALRRVDPGVSRHRRGGGAGPRPRHPARRPAGQRLHRNLDQRHGGGTEGALQAVHAGMGVQAVRRAGGDDRAHRAGIRHHQAGHDLHLSRPGQAPVRLLQRESHHDAADHDRQHRGARRLLHAARHGLAAAAAGTAQAGQAVLPVASGRVPAGRPQGEPSDAVLDRRGQAEDQRLFLLPGQPGVHQSRVGRGVGQAVPRREADSRSMFP